VVFGCEWLVFYLNQCKPAGACSATGQLFRFRGENFLLRKILLTGVPERLKDRRHARHGVQGDVLK
jgi:hypothetical protein